MKIKMEVNDLGIFSKDYAGSLTWEAIKSKGNSGRPQYTHRAKVHGGWLVETQNYNGQCGGLTFVPDPLHEWKLEAV